MRKLKIFEHITLDGVIQYSDDGGFLYGVILSIYKFLGPLKTGTL